jgi:hypothetical protein
MSQHDAADAWLKANDPEYKPAPKRPYEEIAVGGAGDEGTSEDPESGKKSQTNHNAALFGVTDYDGRLNGKRNRVSLEPNANGTESFEVVRERTPERKKDRHKPRDRSDYMREYMRERRQRAKEG